MTLEKAKQELEKFVQLKTTLRPTFVDVLLNAEEVKHGHWLWVDGVRCSICNYKLQTTGLPSYCPNCGAKMDEVTE